MMVYYCLRCVYYKPGMVGLSDYEVEDRINDSLSFSYFCGLHIDPISPDHSTLSRFRQAMTQANAYERLFKEINGQLESHQILIKKGAIVDASVVETRLKPKGKVNYKVTEDTEQAKAVGVKKDYGASVDKQGSWLKKRGQYYYGYKKHYVTDEGGMVLGVVTTKASVNEVSNLQEVLQAADLPEGIPLKADKGYQSEKNAGLLKKKKWKQSYIKESEKGKAVNRLSEEVQ